MSKQETAATCVLLAQNIRSGDIVYLSGTGQWLPDITQARVYSDKTTAMKLIQDAEQTGALDTVMALEVIDVEQTNDPRTPIMPVRLRERIRAYGPTIDYSTDVSYPKYAPVEQ